MTDQFTYEHDLLGRSVFADRISKIVLGMAKCSVLPAGRVLAIDGPWGVGKSWIAQGLPNHLRKYDGIGRCVYINAFEFDYHEDPFSLIASAIWDVTNGISESRATFRDAAKAVLKATLPAVTRAAISAGGRVIGIDPNSFAEELKTAAGAAGELAIESALDSLQQHKESATAFKERLKGLAAESGGSLVIVIDELDRCRPSFALELLERVKHWFDVEGVAFVMFFHGPALHSAIQAAYGPGIDGRAYLKKFVSATLPVPITQGPRRSYSSETEFIKAFLRTQLRDQGGGDLMETIPEVAPLFNARLRDIQAVLMLAEIIGQSAYDWGAYSAYALLMKVCDPSQYDTLPNQQTPELQHEHARLSRYPNDGWGMFIELRKEIEVVVKGDIKQLPSGKTWQPARLIELVQVIKKLDLSSVKLT